jgi:hypothetical protein
MTWQLPDTYHSAGHGRGTATLKFYEGRDNLGWAADVPAGVLEDLYRRCGAFVLWWPSARGDGIMSPRVAVDMLAEDRPHHGVADVVDLPPAACVWGEFRGAPDAEAGTGVA